MNFKRACELVEGDRALVYCEMSGSKKWIDVVEAKTIGNSSIAMEIEGDVFVWHPNTLVPVEKICLWTQIEGRYEDPWITTCNNEFYLNSGLTPEENGFEFCPFCGGEVHWKRLGNELFEELKEAIAS